jgi:DNA (cytosine-5)-methyltransferase 1
MPRTVEPFAGPGGWDEAARLLGEDLDIEGIEVNADAAATAQAAGHRRIVADIRTVDPITYVGTTGLIVSPPCPTFSASGLRSGMGDDYQTALDAITCLGDGCGCGYDSGCLAESVTDPRTALVVEAARFALRLPDVTWMVAEQVPGVEYLWEDLTAELFANGWESADVAVLDAVDYGAGSRRSRAYLYAHRYRPVNLVPIRPRDPIPAPTAAAVLGWPEGEQMRTRGNRKTSGGNLFSLDGPSWCLTGKARSWQRDSDGATWEAADAGALNGFPRDYPWQGSRTAQFQQAGDVVSPLVGAAVLGATLGIEWEPQVRARARALAAGPGPLDRLSPSVRSLLSA